MKHIAIIAAMDEEVESIKRLMVDISIKEIYESQFIMGKLNNKKLVLVKCGVGKVNATMTTQILIDNFDIEYVINVGTAGSLNDNIEIGDLVIAEKLVQHDFDITVFGHEKGYITNIGKYFYSDKSLIEKAKFTIEQMHEKFNQHIGIIATGDIFVQNIDVKNRIKEEFNAECVEMEGAAIAQVCTLDKVPFIVIRAISDKPNGNNNIVFETYLQMACERYAKFIDFFIK